MILFACTKETGEPDQQVSDTLFVKTQNPVFESPLNLAADPSILRKGDSLLLYYSAENKTIGVVISTDDGNTWQSPNGNNSIDYPALKANPEGWDETLETIDVLQVNNEYWMYYTGYIEGQDDNNGTISNYEIGLAISSNGIDFTRHPSSVDQPILSRDTSSINTFDRHAMTSPGVVYDGQTFRMIYAGWNVENNWTGDNAGIRILGASSQDGIIWNKNTEPLIIPSEISYSPDINEASLLFSDGQWYIPFSTSNSIGIARSSNFTGPYEIYPSAIIDPSGDWDSEVTAPDGIIENGKMRLWYHGVKEPVYWPWVIGYAEADFPLSF